MSVSKSHSIKAAPNQSLVRGEVVAIRPEPDGYGLTIDLAIMESENVDDLPNFTRDAIGQTLSCFLSDSDVTLRPGDRIEAKVTYRGGPGGGRYNLLPDDIKKL
ncbi:MAG: hypothetical protein L0229_05590 [Blastocatellia bacterium]|nr:hypothetical protein [Blastocatellia bacterium]